MSAISNKKIIEEIRITLRYWQGVTECEHNYVKPIGGCLRCDIDKMIKDCAILEHINYNDQY